MLECVVPTEDDADIEVQDDMSVESDASTGDESDKDESRSKKKKNKKNKKREVKTFTKGNLHAAKVAYLEKQIKIRKQEESKLVLKLINMLQRCMDGTQRIAYQTITSSVMNLVDWTDKEATFIRRRWASHWKPFIV